MEVTYSSHTGASGKQRRLSHARGSKVSAAAVFDRPRLFQNRHKADKH
jgi:hypothetical protein